MTKKYAYVDPVSREYLFEEDRDLVVEKIAALASKTYAELYCNGELVTVVETNPDGSETWRNAAGEEILSPTELEIQMRRMFSLDTKHIPITVAGE